MVSEMPNTLIITTMILAAVNLSVSVFVIRSESLELFQKLAQVFIIWLFPIFGAIGIWVFIRSMDAPPKAYRPKFGGGSASRGDEHGGM